MGNALPDDGVTAPKHVGAVLMLIVGGLPLVSGVHKLLVVRLPDHLCNKCWLTRISFIVNE